MPHRHRRPRYRTHERDELLAQVIQDTSLAARQEEQHITQEFERRKEQKQVRQVEREDRRRRQIAKARLLETARQERANARRAEILREIQEDDLRLSGRWTAHSARQSAGPPDTAEFDCVQVGPHTDEFVISSLTMDSVERRLGLRAQGSRRRIYRSSVAAAAALAAAFAAVLFIGLGSSRQPIDSTVYPTSEIDVVSATHPVSEIAFRAAALDVTRHGRIASTRQQDTTVGASRAYQSFGQTDPVAPPSAGLRPPQRTRLNVDLNDAEDLWGRGSE